MNYLEDRKFLDQIVEDHHKMTLQAVKVLPKESLEYLGGEVQMLVLHYCELPDVNYSNYGQALEQLDPDSPYWREDYRRAWGVSEIMGWNPVAKKGLQGITRDTQGGYCLPEEELIPILFENAIKDMKNGDLAKGLRGLGCISHILQDSVSSCNSTFFHGSPVLGGQDKKPEPDISGYQVKYLGSDMKTALQGLIEMHKEVIKQSWQSVIDMRQAYRDIPVGSELKKIFYELEMEQQNHGCKVVADLLHTSILLAGHKKTYKSPPLFENQLVNSDFEKDDGENMPLGWYLVRHDKHDKAAKAIWNGHYISPDSYCHSGSRSISIVNAPEAGLEWRQSWPYAIKVKQGDVYRFSAWIKCCKALGEVECKLLLFQENYQLIKSLNLSADLNLQDWQLYSMDFTIPENVSMILISCHSAANPGAYVNTNSSSAIINSFDNLSNQNWI